MWYVIAERKSRIPGRQNTVKKVRLPAPRGEREASRMAGHLSGFGWLASIEEKD